MLDIAQTQAAYQVALDLTRRLELAPRSIAVVNHAWGDPYINVNVTIPTPEGDSRDESVRREAKRRLANMVRLLRHVGTVDKTSSDWEYTLLAAKDLEVIGARHAPFTVKVKVIATMDVSLVCEMVPDGEEEYVEEEVVETRQVTKTRPKYRKVCPPSLLAGL